MDELTKMLTPNVWQTPSVASTGSTASTFSAALDAQKLVAEKAFAIEYQLPFAIRYSTPLAQGVQGNNVSVTDPVGSGTGPALPPSSPSETVSSTGGWYGFGQVKGLLTSVDASATDVFLFTIPTNTNALISIAISAADYTSNQFGTFIRNVNVKNISGVGSIIDMVQDAMTIKQKDWQIDFTISSGNVFLRVYGQASTQIDWRFSGSIITSI